jgi:hypothetical protein
VNVRVWIVRWSCLHVVGFLPWKTTTVLWRWATQQSTDIERGWSCTSTRLLAATVDLREWGFEVTAEVNSCHLTDWKRASSLLRSVTNCMAFTQTVSFIHGS